MFNKIGLVLILVFSYQAHADQLRTITQVVGDACGASFSSGDVVSSSSLASMSGCDGIGSFRWFYFGSYYQLNAMNNSGKFKHIVLRAVNVTSCPVGTELNSESGKCENPCTEMEGNQLGLVAFPEGSSLVSAVCRNSCKATLTSGTWVQGGIQNDPRPFGLYNYSGESCDGTETGGGETGGGETGGGETGGGETGGGETGGGETGGGETGGGETGGGETGGGETGGGETGGGSTGGGSTGGGSTGGGS
ncbi:hypothetical protein AB6D17_25440, partial [Vibrio splendidus]